MLDVPLAFWPADDLLKYRESILRVLESGRVLPSALHVRGLELVHCIEAEMQARGLHFEPGQRIGRFRGGP